MLEEKQVLIILGSKSDQEICAEATKTLDKLCVTYEVVISSAHRTPERTASFAKDAENKGYKVVICMAGYAAHLPGVVSAYTNLPVVAVPLAGSSLNGLDALFAQQMPGGVPVASMTIGKAGAVNSAIFAARVISLLDPKVKQALLAYIADMKEKSVK